MNPMSQHYKGPRIQIGPRLHKEVHAEVLARAQREGVSVSQYVADRMAELVGLPELIWQDPRDQHALLSVDALSAEKGENTAKAS